MSCQSVFAYISTGIFTLTCIAVFSDRFQQYFNTRNPDNWGGQDIGVLDWSFGLAATDCILTFIALALLAVGLATVADKPYYIKV